jgi:type I restriction enzyme S subunit
MRFVLENLPRLTTRPAHIKQLRQTILNLAVQGSLTEKEPGNSNKVKSSSLVLDEPKPYEIDNSWGWVRMDEIVTFTGGSQPPKSTFIFEPRAGYTRLVQIRDFKSDAYLTFVPNEKANRPFNLDDVMIGRYGPPVFQILRGLSGTYNVALMKASPASSVITRDFIFLLLQESRIHDVVVKESERTAGQTGIRLPLLNSFVVGLPPLAEQHRIVTKVDELMTLCDQLETQLTSTAADSRRLLEAVLHEALLPVSEQAA